MATTGSFFFFLFFLSFFSRHGKIIYGPRLDCRCVLWLLTFRVRKKRWMVEMSGRWGRDAMETRLLSFLQNLHHNCWVADHAVFVCGWLTPLRSPPDCFFCVVLESVTYPLGAEILRANWKSDCEQSERPAAADASPNSFPRSRCRAVLIRSWEVFRALFEHVRPTPFLWATSALDRRTAAAIASFPLVLQFFSFTFEIKTQKRKHCRMDLCAVLSCGLALCGCTVYHCFCTTSRQHKPDLLVLNSAA